MTLVLPDLTLLAEKVHQDIIQAGHGRHNASLLCRCFVFNRESYATSSPCPQVLSVNQEDIFQRVEDTLCSLEQNWDRYEPELTARGLTGIHLKYEIEGLRTALEKWNFQVDKRLLLRVLAWIDVILGSFATGFIPLEVVREFKEALEQAIQENV